MTTETNLLNLLCSLAAALRAGNNEAAYSSIQDLGDATLFRRAGAAVQNRAAKEYEQSFGDALAALHPFVEAYDLLLKIVAERAAGRPVDELEARLNAIMIFRDECEELPIASALSTILQGTLARVAA